MQPIEWVVYGSVLLRLLLLPLEKEMGLGGPHHLLRLHLGLDRFADCLHHLTLSTLLLSSLSLLLLLLGRNLLPPQLPFLPDLPAQCSQTNQ